MIDPDDPPDEQIRRQGRIIDALIRQASRQKDVGPSAYRAFRAAITLQRKVAAQTVELESAHLQSERSRKTLAEALESMEGGLALFSDGRLNICNDLFRGLLPDISGRIVPGLFLKRYFELMAISRHLVSTDRKLPDVIGDLASGGAAVSLVAEVGRDRWYQLSTQETSPENTVLLMTEITALVQHNRREKERLIDRQSDYLQAVFENMSAGVCTFSANGDLMMHNARFCDILGVPAEVLGPGLSVLTLLDFMRRRGLVEPGLLHRVDTWRDALNQKGSLTRRVPHGESRVLDIHANVLPDGGFLVELKDVTLESRSTEMLENRVRERTAALTFANASLTRQYEEKARVEEELRVAKERAEAAVSSKTRFLAAASHDVLQPINAAKLLISTLQETTGETPFAPMVARLEGAFSSAEYLVHALLDISRLESADPDTVALGPVCLGGLMSGIRADQLPLAAQKSVRLDVIPCSVFVWSDPIYLLRSVQNLVVNAIQYTDPGGRVVLGCRRRAGRVVLEVWDTGIGIARKDQARVFEEFTRAGDVPLGTGVGLGLSIVDRACRLLGHRLKVRSKPGRGSVFSIEMEEAQGVVRPHSPQIIGDETEEAAHIDFAGCIVLVIENDTDVLYGTAGWLEQRGASVLAARSTAEARVFVEDMGMAPDIILADYQLDGSDRGVQAILDIRAMTRSDVPGILITADRSDPVRRLGARHDIPVLTKPADTARLAVLMNRKIREGSNARLQTKVAGDRDGTGDQGSLTKERAK